VSLQVRSLGETSAWRSLQCWFLSSVYLVPVLLVSLLGSPWSLAQSSEAKPPDVTLRGTLSGKDNQTYKLLPFSVPQGIFRVTVVFSYSGKDEHTAVDLGLFDPQQFRGWSGGRKDVFTVSATDATPSYLPGFVVPGVWQLLIGVPNIRTASRSEYVAKIYFSGAGSVSAEPEVLRAPLKSGPAWFRGDLHMHTAHSDGSCQSQSGKSVPCPLMLTVQTAAKRGLDFIAITDHNSISHYSEMRELQPFFDQLLLIPGRELTSFTGHANLYGTEEYVDFRVGSAEVPNWNALLRNLQKMDGLVSVNHPSRLTGEDCMGCGWTPDPPADLHLVQAIEAINSGRTEGPTAGITFWHEQLNRGIRLTAIGGGDNHNALAPLPGMGSIGYPTTVVRARELSVGGVLESIRAGHVFIDVAGTADRLLELTADLQHQHAEMGDNLSVQEKQLVSFQVHVRKVLGGRVEVNSDSGLLTLDLPPITQADQTLQFPWESDGRRHWLQATVRDASGNLILLGNPIYINFP